MCCEGVLTSVNLIEKRPISSRALMYGEKELLNKILSWDDNDAYKSRSERFLVTCNNRIAYHTR